MNFPNNYTINFQEALSIHRAFLARPKREICNFRRSICLVLLGGSDIFKLLLHVQDEIKD